MAVGLMMLPATAARFWAHEVWSGRRGHADRAGQRRRRPAAELPPAAALGPAIVLLAGAATSSRSWPDATTACSPAASRCTRIGWHEAPRRPDAGRVDAPCRCARRPQTEAAAGGGELLAAGRHGARSRRRCGRGAFLVGRERRRASSSRARPMHNGWRRPTSWSSTACTSKAGSERLCAVPATGPGGGVPARIITPRRAGTASTRMPGPASCTRSAVENIRAALVRRRHPPRRPRSTHRRVCQWAPRPRWMRARAAFAAIPLAQRRVVSTHDAFGYLGDAYGVSFIAPRSWNTESEASAAGVAAVIRELRRHRAHALSSRTSPTGAASSASPRRPARASAERCIPMRWRCPARGGQLPRS